MVPVIHQNDDMKGYEVGVPRFIVAYERDSGEIRLLGGMNAYLFGNNLW